MDNWDNFPTLATVKMDAWQSLASERKSSSAFASAR